ncbi:MULTISPECIES: lysine decarboxylase [unclassified Vibrio]|uniref:lysine decarboxylase n=1 Tax=unclassified Vibrio TaxID=2614977 RepID=UPI0014833244|nr:MULTISPECIES: lysine decarboxylase [unclassified Vibrio]MDQ2192611.1 lysine decarboxylase [Vibrio sp. A14(2019)]MDQ2196161.1 lysine decarboxylase [Vibrio sp. 2017_1457_11]NNN74973.1 lysine decarboxylase [Vibrio sp. B7]NNN91902.1 lysine decarboxylase [Vibrio sp. B8-1]NNO07202.1 lysine decarboxylase [Vibrio sp. B4-12]
MNNISLPIYNSLNNANKKLKGSFHALPIQNLGKTKDVVVSEDFNARLSKVKELELSLTSPFFDSLTDPSKAIDESANILKDMYGSDLSLFVTCGSTISNKIIIEAICKSSDKVLCQRGVHQSIYFSLKAQNSDVNYVQDLICNDDAYIYSADTQGIIDALVRAEETGTSYTTLIINSQTYDGVCFDLQEFLPVVCERAKGIKNIVIDEAWGAWSTFDPKMKEKSAIQNASILSKKYDVNFIVTHSVHKSLFALRQASIINVFGSEDCQTKVVGSHFRNHSTSPSYPILASTELALSHANQYAVQYSNRISEQCEYLKSFINDLSLFRYLSLTLEEEYLIQDPTKLWITCTTKLLSGAKIREILFNKYGIYVSRYSHNSILLNLHHGISNELIGLLANALCEIDKKYKTKNNLLNINVGDIANSFYILYPPGIPILTPGQTICNNVITKINQSIFDDTSLLIVEGN